jgi:glycosyltransferase involved in cell wall biosynthesis
MPDTLVRGLPSALQTPRRRDSGAHDREIAELRSDIKKLRNEIAAVEGYLEGYSLRRMFRRVLARALGMHLHLHVQHAPREMVVPRRYWLPEPLLRPPVISIVTPSLNQGRYLESTIQSVLNQRYPRLEYAIQDGGSSDQSLAVINRHRDRFVHSESRADAGQCQAINRGFAHAESGEIMAYLNSDDLLLPGALNYVAAYFEAHPEVDVVYGHRIIINGSGREIGRWVLPGHSDRMLTWANYVPPETLFWRRRIWDKAGGRVDESFQFAFDWELLLRFREAGAKFVRLPRFLGAFRVHRTQKRATDHFTVGLPEMARLRQRVHGRETNLDDIRRHMNGYMLRHAWQHLLYQLGVSTA